MTFIRKHSRDSEARIVFLKNKVVLLREQMVLNRELSGLTVRNIQHAILMALLLGITYGSRVSGSVMMEQSSP